MAESRYKLVLLRAAVARGRARQVRRRAFRGKEHVLDFLFPGLGQPAPHLPDDVFSVIARYFWDGGPSTEEEAAAAASAAEAISIVRAFAADYVASREEDSELEEEVLRGGGLGARGGGGGGGGARRVTTKTCPCASEPCPRGVRRGMHKQH